MKKLQMMENFKSKWIFFSLANLNITYYKIQNFKNHETKKKDLFFKKLLFQRFENIKLISKLFYF
jgi:hypothetical protein